MAVSGENAVAGAGQGAAAGASFGPWGALIGGVVGAGVGALTGQGPPTYDPQSQQLASLSAAQFNQGMQLQQPGINYLTNFVENPQTIANARSSAIQNVQTQTNNQATYQQSLLQQLGVTPNAQQKTAMTEQNALSTSKGEAGAANAAAKQTYGMQQNALV